jgi:hypothetical protein
MMSRRENGEWMGRNETTRNETKRNAMLPMARHRPSGAIEWSTRTARTAHTSQSPITFQWLEHRLGVGLCDGAAVRHVSAHLLRRWSCGLRRYRKSFYRVSMEEWTLHRDHGERQMQAGWVDSEEEGGLKKRQQNVRWRKTGEALQLNTARRRRH